MKLSYKAYLIISIVSFIVILLCTYVVIGIKYSQLNNEINETPKLTIDGYVKPSGINVINTQPKESVVTQETIKEIQEVHTVTDDTPVAQPEVKPEFIIVDNRTCMAEPKEFIKKFDIPVEQQSRVIAIIYTFDGSAGCITADGVSRLVPLSTAQMNKAGADWRTNLNTQMQALVIAINEEQGGQWLQGMENIRRTYRVNS